jgi:hypothetical protein
MIRKNVVGVILILSIVLTITIRWVGLSGENYRSIIASDGRGYYHYYEAVLGSQSLDSQKANGTYLVYTPDSAVVNKYFVGLPVLWAPFVLPVYAYYSIISNSDIDLYAEGFQKAVSLAALVYLFLGLLAMKKVLQTFDLEQKVINFSLFAFFFGTNLSYYTIIAPSMSHVYSFALIAGFLLYVRKYSMKQNPQYLIYAALLFGIIVLVRPVNGLILLVIPVVWKKEVPFFELLKSNVELMVVAVFLISMIVGLQLLFWYLQTGSLIQWSYAGEGFYFAHPHFADFLISYRKGAFIYTPLILVSLLGFSSIYKENRRRFWFAIAFMLVLFYVLSSWWNWYYGDSYGSRVLIDFYPFFILLLAFKLQEPNFFSRKILPIIASLLIFLNLFQSYQYYHNIMSHYDMNKEKYWYIFGKFGEENEKRLGGNDDIAPYHIKTLDTIFMINNINPSPFYRVSCDSPFRSQNEEQVISTTVDGQQFPCTISIAAEKLMEYKAAYVKMDCIISNDVEELGDVYWTISIRSDYNPSHYYAFRVNAVPMQKDESRADQYHFTLPIPKSKKDEVLISMWNKGRKKFSIEMLQLEVFGITE